MTKAGDKQHGCLVAFAFSPYICTPPSGSVSNDIGFNLHNHFYIYMNDSFKGRADNEIVFSRSVKAGKRIYYIDVKQDRNSELYLSITESKRIKDGDEESRPVFEKHKIFLYREDLNKFLTALQAAADYAQEKGGPITYYGRHNDDFIVDGQLSSGQSEAILRKAERDYDSARKILEDFKLDMDF